MQASPFTLKASDGTDVYVHRWLPESQARATVQIAHGLAEHAGRYARLAEVLTSAGYAVYASDHRGHGLSAPSREALGHFADSDGWHKVLDDLFRVHGRAREEHARVPAILLGHSLGSYFVQHFLFAYPGAVDGAALSGSNGSFGLLAKIGALVAFLEEKRVGTRQASALLQAMSFGAFNARFKPARTEFDWLSRDSVEVDKYMSDPLCGFPATTRLWRDLLFGLSCIENENNVRRVPKNLPVYVFAGALDPVSDATKGLKVLLRRYARVGLTSVEHRFYPGARHEVLNETNRDEVTRDLVGWMDRVLLQASVAKAA